MKKTFFTCFFLGMSVLPTLSKTYDKVDVLERPVPISSIKDIKGFFGYRMEVNRNYLKDFPIDKYVDLSYSGSIRHGIGLRPNNMENG